MKQPKLLAVVLLTLLSLAGVQRARATEYIVNGDFEAGLSPGWSIAGTSPMPFVSSAQTHSGNMAAFLGDDTNAGAESSGDSSIFSDLTAVLPANAMLSFWFSGSTTDTVTFDWQDAYVTDAAGTILATIMHVCTSTSGFQNVTYDLSNFAGQQVMIEFLVHSDGFGDVTNMYVDDVSIQAAVPEPSSIALGLLGLGAFAATALVRRVRRAGA
ncbi:MAG: PEP-CTERM sorting domain-containing protein [Verrucomicrobiota bacterium]|nr:PEP-CTERM sorting domain-containing protein [Verrucomicrobiota bacterium]